MDCTPRDRILQEATSLFGRKGFAATSVREVVEAAGISKPTLYYYFDNKEGLFRECVQAQLAGLGQLVAHALAEEGSVRERLHGFLEQYVGGGLAHPDSVRLVMLATSTTDPNQPECGVLLTFRSILEGLVPLLEEGIASGELRAGFDPRTALRMICGAADIFLFSGLAGDPVPDDFAAQVLELLFRGIDP
jgi:AcrR family transcriptional regulator